MSRKVLRTTCVLLGVLFSLALPAAAQVEYRFGTATELLDAAFYAGQPEDGSDVAGRMAFYGRASNDGKRVAFWVENVSTQWCSFFIVDLGSPSSWRRVTPDYGVTPSAPIFWAPDDSALLVGGYRIPLPPPGQISDIFPNPIHGISPNDASTTSLPSNNWAVALIGPNSNHNVVALPILGDGTEDLSRQPVVLTAFPPDGLSPDWPCVSPDGMLVGFADYHGSAEPGVLPDTSDVYVLKNITTILTAPLQPGTFISSLAPINGSDPNVTSIRVGESDNMAHTASFSQDKSLVIYNEDWNNVFANEAFFQTFANSNFDLMLSNSDGSGSDFRFEEAGNQAWPTTTNGGVRIVFIRAVGPVMHLYMSTIETATPVTGTVLPDNDIETTAPQEAHDGSGTTVDIPASTVIDFPIGAPQEIQVLTPVDPVQEVQLPPDIAAIPVLRDFGPDGTTFTPAVTVTISYTDAEIEGLDEASLRVFRYNSVSGIYDDEVTTGIVRDLANNTISFSVDHFSAFGLGAQADTDGDGIGDDADPDDDNDGIADAQDLMPLDTDNDGIDNADDPDDDSDGSPDLDDPMPLDTDNDGINNDSDPDNDNDGVADAVDGFLFDTDNDGTRNDADTDDDNDGLSDADEISLHGTNPLAGDSDGDGVDDGAEVGAGTDPNDPLNFPALPINPVASVLIVGLLLGCLAIRRLRLGRN